MFFLLPFLQAIAAIFTIWGVYNTPAVNETVVTYGVSAFGEGDGATLAELFKAYGATVLGGLASVVMWLYQRKNSSELLLAVAAWLSNRSDPVAFRRMLLAIGDLLAAEGTKLPGIDEQQVAFFKQSGDNLRITAASLPTDKPLAAATK